MKKCSTYLLLTLGLLALLGATGNAQQGSAASSSKETNNNSSKPADNAVTETPDKMGDYMVIGSLEFGYRGISVDGDHNKFHTDLKHHACPRDFATSLPLRSQQG